MFGKNSNIYLLFSEIMVGENNLIVNMNALSYRQSFAALRVKR
jgi:hypothetical protein